MRRLINRGGLSETSRRSALIAENNASKIRKMILDELDTAIENAQNATLDENAKSSAAYSVGDYVLGQKSYTYDAKNNEFVSDDGRIIPVADKIFSVSDIKNAEYIVRELVADQLNGLKGREFIIKETGEKVHVSRKLLRKYTHNGFMKYAPAVDKTVKMNMSTDVPDLIENATGLRHKSDLNGKHVVFAGRGWNYYDADIAVKFRNEYQIFRSELQIALNSKDNQDYVYDIKNPKKNLIMGAATSENPSASPTRKPALRPMRDFSNNRVVQKNNGVNAKQDYQKIEDSVPNVKRFSIDVDQPVQQTKDLIAVHNLDEEKLLADIKEFGGFPAPSIAIIRQGHDGKDYFYDIAKIRRTTPFHATDFSSHAGQRSSSNSKLTYNSENARANSEIPEVRRFSLDVDHPVQQTKDLIAVHNLDEEKLLADINEIGGFPAPSMVYSLV